MVWRSTDRYGLPYVKLSGNVYYIVVAECRFQVFKEAENLLRVRMGAYNSRGRQGSGSAGLDLELFVVNVAGDGIAKTFSGSSFLGDNAKLAEKGAVRLLKEIVGTRFFQIHSTRAAQETFMADYTFRLDDEDACAAYESLVKSNLRFRKLGKKPTKWLANLKSD